MKKQKKIYPDLEGPKYRIPFEVIGFQALNVNGNYTELIETEPTGTMISLKNRRDYLKWKEQKSKEICDAFNQTLKTRWDKIVSFKVKYLCELEDDHYI